jgi:antitoxin (DNA-binding transcriptional repressor) of toxin-antitoxin stability system
MKAASVRDLRNQFSRMSKWLEAGEVVQVYKRGTPFARVVPEPKAKTFVGACLSAIPLPEDIDEPLDVTWPRSEVSAGHERLAASSE